MRNVEGPTLMLPLGITAGKSSSHQSVLLPPVNQHTITYGSVHSYLLYPKQLSPRSSFLNSTSKGEHSGPSGCC